MNLTLRRFTLCLWCLLAAVVARGGDVDFSRTLRLDYIFSGDVHSQEISLSELTSFAGWAGRRVNLTDVPLRGNGELCMEDALTGRILYRNTFSTLFQEWLSTEEATRVRRAFEAVFLVPMPTDSVRIKLTLRGTHDRLLTEDVRTVNPHDILIRSLDGRSPAPHRDVWCGGASDTCIDVAIVAEGYTVAEAEAFYAKAEEATEALFAHEPFASLKPRFNIVAVALPSTESGVSIPKQGLWKETALGSQFDTFYSDRYLTTLNLRKLNDALVGIPYEHIIILANTENYGGGGIYNNYTLTAANHAKFRPVVVHEFGHSFAGLADEYYYDDQYEEYYYPDTEPWEQNVTTLKDFSSKWADMLPAGTPVPTPPDAQHMERIGVYEGGGYQSKGVFRGYQECRMKTNEWPTFCNVCRRAIRRIVDFYTRGE